MRELQSLEASALMQRLTKPAELESRALVACVQSAAVMSAQLLSTVAADMPLYTLHNERHILNVIGWMEGLLGDHGIENLSTLECAVSILAVYIHDLRMTLDKEERDALPSDPDYLRFRDRYLEERHSVDALRQAGKHYRADLIENHLRTAYIRTTHADGLASRMCRRLQTIAPQCVYRGFDYRRHLEIVAISHNHEVEWLRLQCEKEHLSWRETVGRNEPINFARIGILLRLADLMDFDSSRTPSVLFRHLGLDADLAGRFEELSGQEWKKHLAITGIEWPPGDGPLTYRAANCPHPAIEKSVREFVDLIQREVSQAASELRHLGDEERFSIRLPDVKADVRAARDNGVPLYTYHDWHFRLDQEEITRLLMGESLYGDPSLCIREVLQNALDAVELRELRLRLRASGGQPAEPVDGEFLGPGRFIYDGSDETFTVNLTWGEQSGHQFIRVEDNGTGMTGEVIERYFTQIGKSYYRSADFRGEQAEMRSHGLISTPISTFGIGVLSCFMIADRVQVRTHPGQLSERRQALDLEIFGPGSLFWTRQGTRTRQGTEVTLWLRKELRDKLVRLQHSRELCISRLRGSFGYEDTHKKSDGLDPGFIAAQHVVWPKYPVRVSPPCAEPWAIDDRFHVDRLAPINRDKVARKAAEWGYPSSCIGDVQWELLDWTDDAGEHATGSRIRLWLPINVGAKEPLQFWELATLLEPQIRDVIPLLIVQSMSVEDVHGVHLELPFFPGTGCRAWFDLRGAATPALTADRRTASIPKSESNWRQVLAGVWARYVSHLTGQERERLPQVLCNVWLNKIATPLKALLPYDPRAARLPNDSSGRTGELASASLVLEGARSRARVSATYEFGDDFGSDFHSHRRKITRDPTLEQILDRAPKNARVRAYARAKVLGRSLATDPEFARDLALDLARALAHEVAPTFDQSLDRARRTTGYRDSRLYALHTNWLQEAFFPDLSESWPGAALQGLHGRIGDGLLTAPAAFRFDTQDRQVLFADPEGREPLELSRYEYDICLPMTAIPIGELRRKCAAWREDRRYRAVGVLPFLAPHLVTVWKVHAEQLLRLFCIRRIYAFWPAERLWYKPFADWSRADWQDREHRSLLWNIAEGTVVVARGAHSEKTTSTTGQPFE